MTLWLRMAIRWLDSLPQVNILIFSLLLIMIKSPISQTFSITAAKEPISVDHIDTWYMLEASGTAPSVSDSRWQFHNEGDAIPSPTSAAPYLWKKSVTCFTDGTKSDTVVEFCGSLGKNGIDYDLVPSHSSIVKAEDGTLSPSNVSCAIIKRNADGSAEQLTSVPTGYSIEVRRNDGVVSSNYTPGSSISTSGTTSGITFILKYGTIDVERHDLNVIAEGAQGLTGRGIQSQDYRFKAFSSASMPETPTNDSAWETWSALSNTGYSSTLPYLYRCVRTVYIDGLGNTSVEYLVDGPTVWGQSGSDAVYLDLDNQMDSIVVNSSGAMETPQSFTINATLYKGASPVTGGITRPSASSIEINGVQPNISLSGGVVTIKFTFSTIPTVFEDKHYTVNIPVVYGGVTYQATFTLVPVRAGAAGATAVTYNVLPSQNSLPFARNTDNSVSPASYSITCGYVMTRGSSNNVVANQTNDFNGSWHIFYRFHINGGWNNWLKYEKAVNVSSIFQAIEFCIAKTTTASSVTDAIIVDREVVPVVVGGSNGSNGTNAFVVDLDNEMDAIPCDYNNYTAARSYQLKLSAYYGTTSVQLNSVSAKVTNSAGTTVTAITVDTTNIVSPIVTLLSGTYTDKYYVTFTCTHNTYGTRTVVFSLIPQKAGSPGVSPTIYKLLPSSSALYFKRDVNGVLTGSYTLKCGIVKTTGSSTSAATDFALDGRTIKWGYDDVDPCSNVHNGELNFSASVAEEHSNIVFELYYGSTKIDREVIPILKEGEKGGPGDPGNGVESVSFARQFTMAFVAPSATASGWISSYSSSYPTEAGLSKEKRFLWERKTTTYTQSISPTYEVSLVAQFESGVCANLLEDTAFNDINDMDAWDIKNGAVIARSYDNNNGFNKSPELMSLTDMLRQKVYLSDAVEKLEPSTWYTFSFYARALEYFDIYNSSAAFNSSAPYFEVQNATGSIYLDPGQEITVKVKGYVASSSVKMRYMVYTKTSYGTVSQSEYVEFTSVYAEEKTLVFKNNTSSYVQVYFSGYVYLSDGTSNSSSSVYNRGYISLVRVYRGCMLDTYLCRNDYGAAIAVDSGHPWIVNGKAMSTMGTLDDMGSLPEMTGTYVYFSSDGHIRWQLSSQWKRYSVTFFTSSSLTNDVEYNVLFRLMGVSHNTTIVMPKLERNTMPTEWIEHTNDRMAGDFQHIYADEWASGNTYMYAKGVRHVVRAKKSATGEKTFFRMKKRTSSTGYVSTTEPYSDTTYWEEASYLKFVATDLMLAEEVITDKLTVSKIRGAGGKFILDANGNVTGIGCKFENVMVTGSIRNPFSVVADSLDVNYSDNVVLISRGGGWTDEYSLPWKVSQSGRVIRLVNYMWGSIKSEGSADIDAPTGKCFFEDGITKSTLHISRELITLLGYGDSSTFYGWIVVNRIDLATTKRYGHGLKALAHGRILGTSSQASLSDVRTFDGSQLSVSRQGEGWYRLSFPTNWFNTPLSDLGIILTGWQFTYKGTEYPGKGSIKDIGTNYVDILVSDDDSVNDGTVDFLIYNRDDFGTL